MGESQDQVAPENDESASQRTAAQIETERDTSPRTTIPEFVAAGVTPESTHDHSPDVTDAKPASGTSSEAHLRSSIPSISSILGRFQYVRVLGDGAFGTVLQVWDPELHTHRAIKVPHRKLIESGRVNAEAYVLEARKVAQLGKHVGIVEVFDVQRMDDGTPYVVSEFVSGGSLADRIKAGRIPWQTAVELVAQVSEAIAHAHGKGVVHRDLKPANILLNEEGKPVVVDFGLALGDDEFNYQASVCGTYHYMSPQQIQGEANRVDGRADVYSLGVILYQLLAGRLPFKSRDTTSLRREILESQPAPLRQYNSEVPEELELICRRAMAKEPGDRFSTAADFASELRKLLAPRSQEAAGVPRETRPSRSSSWPMYVALALGAAAVGLFMMFRPSNDRPEPGPAASILVPDVSLDPDLEIHVQKAGEEGTYRGLLTSADLPLKVGDKLQFHVRLPKPMFVYVYWIDFNGTAVRYWPPVDQDVKNHQPIKELASPPKAGAGAEAQWWEVAEAGGPEVVFVGVSEERLGEKELSEFEGHAAFLTNLLGDRSLLSEFEYPEHAQNYVQVDGSLVITRGAGTNPIVSPKTVPTDYTRLSRLFSAYHGWIFATK